MKKSSERNHSVSKPMTPTPVGDRDTECGVRELMSLQNSRKEGKGDVVVAKGGDEGSIVCLSDVKEDRTEVKKGR